MTVTRRLSASELGISPAKALAFSILADVARDRRVIDLLDQHGTQSAVAAEVGVSQATVSRIAKRREAVLDPSPREVIALHVLGEITHEQMMGDLLARSYTLGRVPEGAYDAYLPGTWDQVVSAVGHGMLNADDLAVLQAQAPRG